MICIVASSLYLAACSGGGGSSGTSSPPPPPPPPANQTPTADLTADRTSADEGQMITLSAAGSSDADGDTLNFTWSQTNGPLAELNIAGDMAEVILPEVTQDTNVTIRVTASDGSASDIADIVLSSENIELSPTVTALSAPEATLTGVVNPQQANSALREGVGFGASPALSVVTGLNGSAQLSYYEPNGGVFGSNRPLAIVETVEDNIASAVGNFSNSFPNISHAFAFEAEGKVRTYGFSSGPSAYAELDNFDVPNVCSVQTIDEFSRPPFADNLIVGTRGNGLSLYENEGNISGLDRLGEFERETVLDASGTYCFIIVPEGETDVFAFNSDSGLIETWAPQGMSGLQQGTMIDPNLPSGLDLVDFDAFINSQGLMIFAFLLTDGQHDGDHRVRLIYTDLSGNGPTQADPFFQVERSWDKGVPSALEVFGFGGSPDIFIALRTVPFVGVIENDAEPVLGDVAPDFSDVSYQPTELGATDISEIAITYQDKGIVEFIRDNQLDD